MYEQTKRQLLEVLERTSKNTNQKHLMPYILEQKSLANSEGNTELAKSLNDCKDMMEILLTMNLIPPQSTNDETFDHFLWEYVLDQLSLKTKYDKLKKHVKRIKEALNSIQAHQTYLESRYKLYLLYLENVRKGTSHRQGEHTKKKSHKEKKNEKSKKKKERKKFRYKELKDNGVIAKLNVDVPESTLKLVNFYFYPIEKNGVACFRVSVGVRSSANIPIPLEENKVTLNLENLLRMQEKHQQYLTVCGGEVVLNVNILVHLLNKTFIVPRQRKITTS